nr:methionine adenosyltransferase 2 subunit beta isoform X2 [Mirounga angustirostris]
MPEMPEDMEQEEVNVPSRRVLITGATGLLGRAVYKEFKQNNWHAFGCGFRRARPKFEQVNLLDSEAVHHIIHDFQPHVIVHCAAERRPDVVENQPDAASQLNVDASRNLAKEAALIGAFLIYISSDYVFDGTNPPYREEDVPSPLNLYGKTKLEGEKAVLENNLGAAVLRIPVLYGEVEKLEESAVTVMFDKVQFSNKSANMDHWQQRFPTHVKDVATVCRQLAEKRMLDPSIKGTFHWSGNEQMTKYEMACAIADAFNLPSSHLRPTSMNQLSIPDPCAMALMTVTVSVTVPSRGHQPMRCTAPTATEATTYLLAEHQREDTSNLRSTAVRKQTIPLLLLTYCQKDSSSLTLHHNAYIIYLTSHHIGIFLSHIVIRRRMRKAQGDCVTHPRSYSRWQSWN